MHPRPAPRVPISRTFKAPYLGRSCSCQSEGHRDTGAHTGKASGNLAHTSPEDTLWRGDGGK